MDVKIYTDGAARGNPDGPGGYGTVIQFIDGKGTLHEREFSQGYNKTTNNRDLWERLLKAKEPHTVTFHWVKGHAGHPMNERCDMLATTAADGDNKIDDEGVITNE